VIDEEVKATLLAMIEPLARQGEEMLSQEREHHRERVDRIGAAHAQEIERYREYVARADEARAERAEHLALTRRCADAHERIAAALEQLVAARRTR
jgi:hypothetical protein